MNISTEQLFEQARTHNHFVQEVLPESLLRQLYDLLKWGPTSANSSPARLIFVQSPDAKQRLAACMNQGNIDKVLHAPVTAIIGMDMAFYEQLPQLYPHADAKSWFEGQPELIASTAMRNSSLQGGYLIMAARAIGLDCGPMSGFDAAQLDTVFWASSSIKTNFVCTLGHGITSKLHPRSPRLSFEQACQIV